jgi:DNA-binding response OmpR family regulator
MADQDKILVIDDDDDFKASIRPALEAAGYTMLQAASGREGLRMLTERGPDVIVLDIMMETSEEGYSVNQAIKYQDAYAAYRDIPILMVSSIRETPDERYPRASEVDMIRPDLYMTKPLDIDRFLGVIAKLCRRAKH